MLLERGGNGAPGGEGRPGERAWRGGGQERDLGGGVLEEGGGKWGGRASRTTALGRDTKKTKRKNV